MADPAKFDVVLELADLPHNGLEVSGSSLLAFLEGVKTAYRHGELCAEEEGQGAGDDQITLNFHLVVNRSAPEVASCDDPAPDLTRRQTEIAHLLERGLTNKEIAKKLNISPATVKNHVHAILEKLDLDRRSKVAGYLRSRSVLVISTQGGLSS